MAGRDTSEASYFDASERGAVEDFWRVYEANFDRVFDLMRGHALAHPEFQRVLASMSEEQIVQLRDAARGRVGRALRGDAVEYEQALQAEATAFARHGVGFADWYAIMRAIPHHLAPLLIAEYGASATRLDAALRVMRKYLDRTMAFLGTAYIEAKEAALRTQELDLATTLESVGGGVITTDAEGRIVRMNTVAQRLTGWTLADARERALADVFRVVDEDTGELVADALDAVPPDPAAVQVARRRLLLVAKDGPPCPIAHSAAPLRNPDGSARGAVLVFRDESNDRERERALRESEARKVAILDTALDAIVTMDHEGKIVDFNRAAVAMFGWWRHQAIGRKCEIIIPEHLREAHRAGLARHLATGERKLLGRRIEIEGLRADGTQFPVELALVRIAHEGPAMFTAYLRDISEAKRTREELRALTARLREAHEEEGRRIAREVHDVVGHSLTAIKLDIGFISRHVSAALDEPRCVAVRARCDAVAGLVDTTLQAVRRIASHLRPPVLDDLGLEAAVEWQAEDFERRTGIHVRVHRAEEELDLNAERATALYRIVEEALTNVARHAEAKGVDVELRRSPEGVTLSVRDDGRGIDDSARQKRGVLGIVGMRERVAAFGGTLSVAGENGRGTTVLVSLPPADGSELS